MSKHHPNLACLDGIDHHSDENRRRGIDLCHRADHDGHDRAGHGRGRAGPESDHGQSCRKTSPLEYDHLNYAFIMVFPKECVHTEEFLR